MVVFMSIRLATIKVNHSRVASASVLLHYLPRSVGYGQVELVIAIMTPSSLDYIEVPRHWHFIYFTM